MHYTITYKYKEKSNWHLKSGNKCIYTDIQKYEVDNLEDCIAVMKDILDVPDTEMTLEDVHKEFDNITDNLTDSKAELIKTYYNGRLEVFKNAVKSVSSWEDTPTVKISSHLIKPEWNEFNLSDVEDDSEQLESFLEISANIKD